MSDGLQIIASILEKGSISDLRGLENELMVKEEEELSVLTYVKSHIRRYGALPHIDTVEDELGIEFGDTPENVDFYLGKLHKRYVYNKARSKFDALQGTLLCKKEKFDLDVYQNILKSMHRDVVPYSNTADGAITLHDSLHKVNNQYGEEELVEGLLGASSGFPSLDEQTDGYLNSDLITWVARPGIGKTWILLAQAIAAWESGKSVLFLSMEMEDELISKRVTCFCAGIEPKLRKKRKLSMYAKQKQNDFVNSVEANDKFVILNGDKYSNTNGLEYAIQEFSPDIIYIDSAYLMTPSTGRSNMGRYESVSYVMDDLKKMAKRRKRPIVITMQFNRQAGKGGDKGSLETIGYSDTISTHSSIVISIEKGRIIVEDKIVIKDGKSVVVGSKETSPYRILRIMKGREDEGGMFAINYSFAKTDFSEVELSVALDENTER